MQFTITTIIAAASIFSTGAFAAPAAAPVTDVNADNALVARACDFYARVDSVWQENSLTRRRITYANSGGFNTADQCGLFTGEDAVAKCSAINNNIGCYLHNGLNTYVIDHNQVLGVAGDNAAECLLRAFRDKLGRATGCADRS